MLAAWEGRSGLEMREWKDTRETGLSETNGVIEETKSRSTFAAVRVGLHSFLLEPLVNNVRLFSVWVIAFR